MTARGPHAIQAKTNYEERFGIVPSGTQNHGGRHKPPAVQRLSAEQASWRPVP